MWDTLSEQKVLVDMKNGKKSISPATVVSFSGKDRTSLEVRGSTGIGEVDRVLGGGVIEGEVILLSGEPGIGKSTILLQVFMNFASKGKVLYVSGEESTGQLSTRFNRLVGTVAESSAVSSGSRTGKLSSTTSAGSGTGKLNSAASEISHKKEVVFDFSKFKITEETDVDKVIEAIRKMKPVAVAIDSIQAMYTGDVRSFAGSTSQVRECGMRLTRCAKELRIPMFIVGQVTKEGVVAGPKVLEHVVDAVLYFEGDEFGMYRILRGMKNRFGPTDEVGIFEMTSNGLIEVEDPTRIFCNAGNSRKTGVVLSGVFKGSRVLLVEIQALTSPAVFAAPRRVSTGFGKSRLDMLCAVLTRRAGVNLSGDDVFVNVMGGLRLNDPAIDLAICTAIVSAKKDKPVGIDGVFVGEVGLSGEVRPVGFRDRITSEVKRRKLSIIGPDLRGRESLKGIISRVFSK